MSENVESVWWINAPERAGHIERLRTKLFEIAGQGSGHISREDIPFSTSIPVAEVETLKDERLQNALLRQRDDILNGSRMLTIPVARIVSRELSHVVSVPRSPIEFPGDPNANVS